MEFGLDPKAAEQPHTKQSRFRLRLCVRIGPQLQETSTLKFLLGGLDVTIKSKNGDAPSGTDWIVFEATGFPTEASAEKYGERLRIVVQLAGLCSGPGVDPGKGSVTNWVSPEFLREFGMLKPGQRSVPDVHGLTVFPDDGNNLVAHMGPASVRVESNPSLFVAALEKLADQDIALHDPHLIAAIRLLNLIRLHQPPLVGFLLSVIAIEPLGQTEKWTEIENRYLNDLLKKVESDNGLSETHKRRVSHAIRRTISNGATGLKEGVVRLLESLELDELIDDWKHLYDERSALVHGREQVDAEKYGPLADRGAKLAKAVVRELLRRKGIDLP